MKIIIWAFCLLKIEFIEVIVQLDICYRDHTNPTIHTIYLYDWDTTFCKNEIRTIRRLYYTTKKEYTPEQYLPKRASCIICVFDIKYIFRKYIRTDGFEIPMLFLSFKHLLMEVGVDDDDGAFCCSAYLAHGALIALEQVLVTYPTSTPLQPCMPLLRRNKQL